MTWYSDMLDAISEKVSWEVGRDVEVESFSSFVTEDYRVETTFWLTDRTVYEYPGDFSSFLEEHFGGI